jgi:hypothetical protein
LPIAVGSSLTGKVTSAACQGSYLDLFVQSEGQTVRLQLPGDQELAVGDTVTFAVARDRVVVLADQPEDEERADA